MREVRVATRRNPVPVLQPSIRNPSGRAWYVPRRIWSRILITASAVAVISFPAYINDSIWIGPGIFLTVLVVWHIAAARHALPWIPGLIAAAACVQWILAPWAAYHLPVTNPLSGMAVGADEYFAFATPALVALVLGLYLPNRRLGRSNVDRSVAVHERSARSIRLTAEAMIAIGAAANVLSSFGLAAGNLKFAMHLVTILGFVGALTLALLRVPGWHWRALVPFAFVAYTAAGEGIFVDLLFWVVYFAISVAYQYRVKTRILLPGVIAVLVAVITINGYKNFYREAIRLTGSDSDVRASMAGDAFIELIQAPQRLLSAQSLSFSINRLNQGWVTTRALAWTPRVEPFAGGETVETAVRAAIVPRIFDNTKYVAGGKYNTPRFTGIQLYNETSINLSIAGEMYVNYGLALGAVAVFVYGSFIGWIFSLFVRWSNSSQLWWAWAPFVLYSSLSAEGGLGETLNQIVKSTMVMAAVVLLAPAWARLAAKLRSDRRRRAARRFPLPQLGGSV